MADKSSSPYENEAMERINLHTPLSIRSSFAFPLQSSTNRRDVMIGGLWLLVPVVGWLLNMGHRITFVHNMMHGRAPMPAWNSYRNLLRHGSVTFLAMVYYYLPAMLLAAYYAVAPNLFIAIAAAAFFLTATILIPGYMSHYCVDFGIAQMFNVRASFTHVRASGRAYWHAWMIAITALALSFTGILFLGVGFLFTSVWFWQVAGFSFATVMAQRHALTMRTST